MPRVFAAPIETRPLGSVLGLASTCAERCRELNAAVLASSVTQASTRVGGALSRGLDGADGWRRATTGRAFQVEGRVVWHVLALPHWGFFAPDVHAGTWLNRNVRGFLRGYIRAGVRAAYAGRDTLNLEHRPAVSIGADWTADGVLLLELVLGYDHPSCPARPGERPPAAYVDVTSQPLTPELLIARVHAGLGAYWQADLEPLELGASAALSPREDPLEPAASSVRREVPAGVVAGWRAHRGARVTLATDALTAIHRVREVERRATHCFERGLSVDASSVEPLADAPLDGARPDDVLAVLRALAPA